jgi:hypothetical protein
MFLQGPTAAFLTSIDAVTGIWKNEDVKIVNPFEIVADDV